MSFLEGAKPSLTKALWLFLSLGALAFGAFGNQPEVTPRAGLPWMVQKLGSPGSVKIAYLGGSITAADNGWRSKVTQWFQQNFPQITFREINAGFSGTGGELGACRIQEHVLSQKPDLVVIEFAVNGCGSTDQRAIRAVEGMVRQVWRNDPKTEIFLIHSICADHLKEVLAGCPPVTVRQLERVASHYGIPSINTGTEVARRLQENTLRFSPNHPVSVGEAPFYSLDDWHPSRPLGHQIYFETIQKALGPLLGKSGNQEPSLHLLSQSIDEENWTEAAIVPFTKIEKEGDWQIVDPPENIASRQPYSRFFPEVWSADREGSGFNFEFEGTCFGILGFRSEDGAFFSVQVDDEPPELFSFAGNTKGIGSTKAWFYPKDLPTERHRVQIRLVARSPENLALLQSTGQIPKTSDLVERNVFYVGAVLLAGKLIP